MNKKLYVLSLLMTAFIGGLLYSAQGGHESDESLDALLDEVAENFDATSAATVCSRVAPVPAPRPRSSFRTEEAYRAYCAKREVRSTPLDDDSSDDDDLFKYAAPPVTVNREGILRQIQDELLKEVVEGFVKEDVIHQKTYTKLIVPVVARHPDAGDTVVLLVKYKGEEEYRLPFDTVKRSFFEGNVIPNVKEKDLYDAVEEALYSTVMNEEVLGDLDLNKKRDLVFLKSGLGTSEGVVFVFPKFFIPGRRLQNELPQFDEFPIEHVKWFDLDSIFESPTNRIPLGHSYSFRHAGRDINEIVLNQYDYEMLREFSEGAVKQSNNMVDFFISKKSFDENAFDYAYQHGEYQYPEGEQDVIPFYDKGRRYYEFTNFWEAPIVIDGFTYKSSEHYYQAKKYEYILQGGIDFVEEQFFIRDALDHLVLKEDFIGSEVACCSQKRILVQDDAPSLVYDAIRDRWRKVVEASSPGDSRRAAGKMGGDKGKGFKNSFIDPQFHFELKDAAMMRALRAKFTQHPDLADKLLKTENAWLYEAAPPDNYWGVGLNTDAVYRNVPLKGQNKLGRMLMQVRSELRSGELRIPLQVPRHSCRRYGGAAAAAPRP